MSIKDALYDLLIADTAVSDEVSARVHPQFAPASSALPYIVLQQVSADHFEHMTAAAGMVTVRVQIDCYAATNISLELVVEAVREALDGFRGDMGTPAVAVRRCHLEGDRDGLVPSSGKDEKHTFRRNMDFMISHTETVPTFV